jgi:hypothetical protein
VSRRLSSLLDFSDSNGLACNNSINIVFFDLIEGVV